jgi:hypothetical protein
MTSCPAITCAVGLLISFGITPQRTLPLPADEMRQSVAPSRISQSASLANSNNAAAMSRLQEKKKEFEAVSALERASALFLKRIEGLADDCEVMADAGQGLFLTPLPVF